MLRTFLRTKIHRATVTDANLQYEGSVSIDTVLLEASGIEPFEQVDIYNITNGERLTTYAIPGQRGDICINGAAAWKAKKGDLVIIACYGQFNDEEVRTFIPKLIFVDDKNQIKNIHS